MSGFRSFKIGVIQSNPEKSKHLETATVQLGKFSVDFVNLRTGMVSVNLDKNIIYLLSALCI